MKKWIQHLFVVFALVGLDQLTKLWARTQFAGGDSLVIIPNVFRFIYHENTGAVWGILSDQAFFLSIVTVIALIIMLWFYVKMPKTKHYRPLLWILLFIASGAIGNFIDRVFFGYVTDFIYFELIDFPVFNVADCYVTVSVIVLAILSFFYYKEDDFDCFSIKKKSNTERHEL